MTSSLQASSFIVIPGMLLKPVIVFSIGKKVKTVDFSETFVACYLKLIELITTCDY